jgi:hypothetical protein
VNKEERVVYMADWFQHLTPEKREERNEGAKDWQQKHPEQFRKKCEEYRKLRKNAEYWKEYFRKLKKWAVDKKGRKCEDCGLVSEYDCVYDFHHENGVGTWSKEENIGQWAFLCAKCWADFCEWFKKKQDSDENIISIISYLPEYMLYYKVKVEFT